MTTRKDFVTASAGIPIIIVLVIARSMGKSIFFLLLLTSGEINMTISPRAGFPPPHIDKSFSLSRAR
jgi:hypothetical protein